MNLTTSPLPRITLPGRLVFIRHGETDWNVAGRLQGNRDIPINPKGVDQALETGRRMKALLALWGKNQHSGFDFESLDFHASPMTRTCQTMELMRSAMGLPAQPYRTDGRLREISFGQWEGMTWAEIKAANRTAVKIRSGNKWNFVPPDGESYAMLAERVGAWLNDLKGDTCVVSHGGVGRALMVLAGGVSTGQAIEANITQGRLLVFDHNTCQWI